jgi:RNA polymerase sigma-70 factor, ECF subfamily
VDDSGTLPDNSKGVSLPAQSIAGYSRYSLPPDFPFVTLLALARGADKAALSALYKRFLPPVYRFILGRVKSVPVAEDLTSDTFFAMLEGITTVRAEDEMGFAAWLLGVARNIVSQYFRRQRLQLNNHPELYQRQEEAAVAEEDDPLAVLTARESWSEVLAALDRLTHEQRLVVLYRCVHGFSTEEVGRALGKPANAIRGLQFRALASLARSLGTQGRDQGRYWRGGQRGPDPRG